MNGTAFTTPAAVARSTRPAALSGLIASGFSQTTALTAAMAAWASSAWVAFGVQMCTTSISSRSIRSRPEFAVCSACQASAALRASSGVADATACTTPPAARTAAACTSPMKPVPMMPDLMRSMGFLSPVGDSGGSRAGRLFSSGEGDGEDDDHSSDHLLLAGVQTGQDEPIVDQADQQGTEQGS